MQRAVDESGHQLEATDGVPEAAAADVHLLHRDLHHFV
jgi:hypothetical protein